MLDPPHVPAAVIQQAAQEQAARSPTRPPRAPVPQVEEEIEVHVAPKRQVSHPKDEIDEEIEYDDDFEAAEDDDEAEYQPSIKVVENSKVKSTGSASPPTPITGEMERSGSSKLVTIRPTSSQSMRAASPGAKDLVAPAAMEEVKKALESENKKLAKAQAVAPTPDSRKRGFLQEYESTMPKFNLASSSSPSAKAARTRLTELKAMKVFSRWQVEKIDLFRQRPQKDINLFLAGKSLKYCKLRSTMSQTGDDDVEVGVVTDEVFADEKEMQFPTLTLGQAAKSDGELLPFLRRVMPLFEASMAESARRRGAGYGDGVGPGEVRSEGRCSLADSFVSTCIGAPVSIIDLALCPQWYGANHALVLYSWPQVQLPPSAAGSALQSFTRPLRSLMGLYPLLSSSSGGGAEHAPRPARCLYSFCRLGSVAVVQGRPHFIVAGSEMGSLLVFDLREKPHRPGDQGLTSRPVEGDADAPPSQDGELAHFEGPIWLGSEFSTDQFAFSSVQKDQRDADGDAMLMGSAADLVGGMHCVEICCVRCSDMTSGDCLIFAMDLMGVVSFWRVLELATAGQKSVKLALQGSLSLSAGAGLVGDFLGASSLCIHPQQQARFVAVSTSGVRQADRGGPTKGAFGPTSLDLTPVKEQDEEIVPGPFLSQPCSAAFNPFFPGLLLVSYSEGDLALFDCSICVPVTHWAGAAGKACASTVAWSTRRPSVFFVKSEGQLDVWDLAASTHAPVQGISLQGVFEPERSVCSDLYVGPDGRPLVAVGGTVLVLGLPPGLTSPLQTRPPQLQHAEVPLESLLVEGFKTAELFPTTRRAIRTVEVPSFCALERDVLQLVLAGIHPLQAWV